MRTSFVAMLAAASAVSAQTQPAPKTSGNPAGLKYLATLPIKEGSPLRGSITAESGPDGTGVNFKVSFAGLPSAGGPFMYHIHEKPVPENGNCTATGAHLDPYKRGEVPICDASKPETCQTGDLSGKFGNITAGPFNAEYLDLYTSTNMADPSFLGNLSFVLHLSNKTRIGCANFIKVGGATPSSGVLLPSAAASASGPSYNTTVKPTGTPSAPTPTSSKPSQFTGAAAKVAGGAGAFLAAAAALML